jgi:hypothetical protein
LLPFKNSLGVEGREVVNSKIPGTQNTEAELKFDPSRKNAGNNRPDNPFTRKK